MSAHSHSWKPLPAGAKAFIGLVVFAGTATLLYGAIHQSSKNIAEFICYLGIGILELSFSETLILGAVSMLAQCLYPDRPKAIQVTFNICAGSVSTALAYW